MGKSQHQAKKAQSMSKDDQDSQQDRRGMTHRMVTRPSASQTRVAIVALCCSLLLFTLIGLLATTYITHATPIVGTPTDTPTVSTSPTTAPTDTPTTAPTDTPTTAPSPTPTQAPSPTPTRTRPTPTPTQRPKPTPTPQPGSTPTQQPGSTPTQQPGPTATTPSSGQILPTTPANPQGNATVIPTTPTSTNNGAGLAKPTSTVFQTAGATAIPDQSSSTTSNATTASGSSHTILFLIIGILTTITVLAAAALFLTRKFLNPITQTQTNLPPSGARPWSRVRTASMSGDTNIYGWENTDTIHQHGDESDLPFVTQPAFGNSGYPDPAMAMAMAAATPSPLMGIPHTESGDGTWMAAQNTPASNPDWNIPPAMLNDLASNYGWNAVPDVLNNLTSNPGWNATPEPEVQDGLALLPANDFAMQESAGNPLPTAIPSTPTVATTPTSFSPPTGASGQMRSIRVSRLQSMSQTGQEQEG